MAEDAVNLIAPVTADAVSVPAGLLVVSVNPVLGTVKESVEAVHVVLLAHLKILIGAKFSLTRIRVSALCVKYILSISMAEVLYNVPTLKSK